MPTSWGKYATLTLVITGLAAGTVLVGQRQSLFSSASEASPSPLLPVSASSQVMFYRLKALYPQAVKIGDEVYLATDASSPSVKTFIFARLTDLAPPTGRILRAWLVNSAAKVYSGAGVAEIVAETGRPVAYLVDVRDGDLEGFATLILSFDLTPDQSAPLLPMMHLPL